jgi:uncharacterized YccA/Bax inhibitor family protein
MPARLAIRSGNPALTTDTFARPRRAFGEEVMTIGGAVNKSILALLIVFVAAAWTWNLGPRDPRLPALVIGGLLGGLVTAMVTVFRREWAPYTTPLYAALQGLLLGGISLTFEARYPGLVGQAVLLTFGTLAALLFAYRSGLLRASESFTKGVVAATGGIMLFYLASLVMGLFGVRAPLIHGSGTFSIVFSLFVVGVAALNLVLDFDLIERGAKSGAPKYMEWYGAFALLVTLVWLYLEMLRLLSKLQERR